MKKVVVVPTLNPGDLWKKWIQAMAEQTMQPDTVLVIDSSSEDGTVIESINAGFDVHVIKRAQFNHGATRQLACDIINDAEIYIYLTQDAILATEDAIENLVRSFEIREVGIVYGRQLPRRGAGPIEAHARHFSYPENSEIRSFADRHIYGMKSAFVSNSFCAYRKTALDDVGGFPSSTILCEDMFVAAKMLMGGWSVGYCSEASVFHSHSYSISQEFRRYFDIGVFHCQEPWIRNAFGGAEGEGIKFVKSEIRYLLENDLRRIPEALLRTFVKMVGYRSGLKSIKMPVQVKRFLSLHKSYWS